MELKALQKIQKSIEDLRIEQCHGLSIETMDTKLHSIEMEVFKLMDKVCEGKADSTSEKTCGYAKLLRRCLLTLKYLKNHKELLKVLKYFYLINPRFNMAQNGCEVLSMAMRYNG